MNTNLIFKSLKIPCQTHPKISKIKLHFGWAWYIYYEPEEHAVKVGLPAEGQVTLLAAPPILQVATTAEAPTTIVEEVVKISEEMRQPCAQDPETTV